MSTIPPSLPNTPFSPISQIEYHISCLYTPQQSSLSSKPINLSNSSTFLTSFIQLQNLPLLKNILNTSQSIHSKFYAAQSLIDLITHHYLSIPHSETNDLYTSIISYLFNNSDYLSTQSTQFIKKILIKLLTRIIRINWLYSSQMKNIYHDVISNSKEDQVNSLMLPFAIFSELITQFQTYDIPPKHKMKKAIVDFKECALLPIFEYSIQELCSLFQHQIKTERIEDMFLFIEEVIKCIRECLEYDDDINAKEDYYSKYEIKPVYIPNNKKRMRDKTLDIDLLESLVQNLFDTNNLMIKASASHKNSSNSSNSGQCLILLQKLLAMKIVYLGDKRMHLLKIYQDGICNILFNKNGIINHEHLCKLIYTCRKNYSVSDLVINENFLNYICMFTQDTLKDNFIEGINGFIYLLQYFAYLSFGIERMSYISRLTIKGFIVTLLSNIILKNKQLYEEYTSSYTIISEEQLNDLITSFGLCGYCAYEEMVNILNENIHQTQETKLNSLFIRYGISLMKGRYELFTDIKMVNKSTENELMIDSMHLTELIPNNVVTSITFILKSFGVIQSYQNTNCKGHNKVYDYQLNIALLSFIKFFTKYFFSQHLPNKFHHFFQQIMQQLNLASIGELVSFIIDTLINLCQQGMIELTKTIKIIQIIEGNTMIEYSGKVYVGKIQLTMDFVPHLQELIALIVKVDPNEKRKIRIVLLSSLFNLYAMMISYDNALQQFLSQFSFESFASNTNKELDYAVNSLSALIKNIKKRSEYEIFIERIMPLIELIIVCFVKQKDINGTMLNILKLFKELTYNSYNRILFKINSDCPYKLFKMTMEIVRHFYTISKKSNAYGISTNENEKYLMQIEPISLIVRILNNMFMGEFIQMSMIVNAEFMNIKELFQIVMMLITGVKHEDLLGYIGKMKYVYDILKVVYCDYGRCAEVNEVILKHVILLLSEGLECSYSNNTVCNVLYLLGKEYILLLQQQQHPQENQSKELLQVFFEKQSITMQNIFIKLLKMIINDYNNTNESSSSNNADYNNAFSLEILSKPLLVMGIIYKNEYIKLMASTGCSAIIDTEHFSQNDKGIINELFISLYERVSLSDYMINTNSNHGIFLQDLKMLSIKLKEMIDNHQYQ